MAASTHQKSPETLRKENQCYDDTPMVIKSYLKKQFADIVSENLETMIVSLLCGPRSKPVIVMADTILEQLVELTGEKCTLQTPSNGTQRILVFMADQTAVWLNNVVEESDEMMLDKKEKKLQGIEEGGKGDAGDDQDDIDEDVEIITKKKRPSGMSKTSQSGAGDAAPKKGGDEKPAQPSSRPYKTKQSTDDGNKDNASGQGSKRPSKGDGKPGDGKSGDGKPGDGKPGDGKPGDGKPGGGKSGDEKSDTGKGGGDKKPVTSKPKSKTATREGSKQGTEQKGTSDAKGAGAKGQGSGRTSGRAPMSKSSSKPIEKKSTDKGPSGPPTPGGTTRPSSISKDLGKGSQDGVKTSPPETGKSPRGSQVPSQRTRTASELRREKVADILSTHLSQLIQETDKKPSPRQEALQDIITKKIEDKVGPRDSTTIDAIRDASALIATYIDKIADTTEQEYGDKTPVQNLVPLAQRGKGPVFSVRKESSDYSIKQITNTEAKGKVYRSKGLPTPGAISLTPGGFKPNETKEWANWANEVASMADKWSKWIDSTVTDAMKSAEKRKAAGVTSSPSTSSWRDWKETAGAEALEWRRNKKLFDTQAKLFSEKAGSSLKPNKSASSPEVKKIQNKKNTP